MSKKNIDLMEQFMRLEVLLHRYQIFNLRSFGPFGSPHRGQGRVLSILKMQPEISQKELGYLLDMRNQSLGELLNKLEKSGYITRTPSEEDRRTTNIKLTPEGAKAAEAAREAKSGKDLFSSLSEEEQAKLSGFLDRIIAELEGLFADGEPDMREFGHGMGPWCNRFGGHGQDAPPHSHGPFGGKSGGFGVHPDMRHFGHMREAWKGRGRRPCTEAFNQHYGGPMSGYGFDGPQRDGSEDDRPQGKDEPEEK